MGGRREDRTRKRADQMMKKIVAMVLALALPATASAGPLMEAAERAARELTQAQAESQDGRGRFWVGIVLLGAGATLGVLGGTEFRDDEDEPGDIDEVDDGDVTEKAMFFGGLAAAGLGTVLIVRGHNSAVMRVVARPGRVMVKQSVRF
jgi:hypothetical protein